MMGRRLAAVFFVAAVLVPRAACVEEQFVNSLMSGAANLASAGATIMNMNYVTQYTAPKKPDSKFHRDPWTDARMLDPNPILGWTHEDVMLKNYYQGNEWNREYSQVPLSWGLSSGFGDAYTSQMIKYQCPTQNQYASIMQGDKLPTLDKMYPPWCQPTGGSQMPDHPGVYVKGGMYGKPMYHLNGQPTMTDFNPFFSKEVGSAPNMKSVA